MQTITAQQVRDKHAAGLVVWPYPRKGVIVVNGFQRYTAGQAALAVAKALNATQLNAN